MKQLLACLLITSIAYGHREDTAVQAMQTGWNLDVLSASSRLFMAVCESREEEVRKELDRGACVDYLSTAAKQTTAGAAKKILNAYAMRFTEKLMDEAPDIADEELIEEYFDAYKGDADACKVGRLMKSAKRQLFCAFANADIEIDPDCMNARDADLMTSLMWYSLYHNVYMVQKLIAAGADTALMNIVDETAMDLVHPEDKELLACFAIDKSPPSTLCYDQSDDATLKE